MSVNDIYEKLKHLKPILCNDGINILGIFGSYARGDYTNNSDIDILYEIQDIKAFMEKNKGFSAFSKLADTKEFLKKELNKEVDFVDKDSLNEIGKEFILKEVKYV
jgi:predicted nucleotidyltransferase